MGVANVIYEVAIANKRLILLIDRVNYDRTVANASFAVRIVAL